MVTCRVRFDVQLTELKAMLGVVGETRIVMGCITQIEDGRFSIEDLSASLRLDLSDAAVAAGFITGTSTLTTSEPASNMCACKKASLTTHLWQPIFTMSRESQPSSYSTSYFPTHEILAT
jgi:hypothetical protein